LIGFNNPIIGGCQIVQTHTSGRGFTRNYRVARTVLIGESWSLTTTGNKE
jgi:hypothetical protein